MERQDFITIVIGKDETLLHSREMICEVAGCKTRRAMTVEDIADILGHEKIIALVICYTLSDPEQRAVLEAAALASKEVPILQIKKGETRPAELFNFITSAVAVSQ